MKSESRPAIEDSPHDDEEAVPAASVVLVREAADGGAELLVVRRSPRLAFHPGAWVFPGGRVDAADAEGVDATSAVRVAAVREVREECGLALDFSALVPICLWVTPPGLARRFATSFFLAAAPRGPVQVDGQEIVDYRWISARDLLQRQRDGEIELAVSGFVLATRFSDFSSVSELLQAVAAWPEELLEPRLHPVEGGRLALYRPDVAYDTGELDAVGPKHRMLVLDAGWRYVRSFDSVQDEPSEPTPTSMPVVAREGRDSTG